MTGHAWRLVLLALAASSPALAQVPPAPLIDAVRSGADVVLSWTPDPGALLYRVYRTSDMAQAFVEIGQSASGGFADRGAVAAPPVQLFYRVHGENASGQGPGSNLAFKLNLTLDCADQPCAVSFPYRFWPNGTPGTAQSLRDLCTLSSSLRQVRKALDTGGCRVYGTESCSSPVPPRYTLDRGEAYVLSSPAGAPPFVLDVVGAHDPDFAPGGPRAVPLVAACPSCAIQINLVSIPYHAAATRASELCAELAAAGQPIRGVEKLEWLARHPPYHFCGTGIGDFPLVTGTAYFIVAASDGGWQPEVR